MTAAFTVAAAITPGISVTAAILAAAGIAAPVVHHQVHAARQDAAQHLSDAERRELLRVLGNVRIYDRDMHGLVGLVMRRLAGHTGAVNHRLDLVAETIDKAIASAFTSGYIKGMRDRPDDEDPPRLRSV